MCIRDSPKPVDSPPRSPQLLTPSKAALEVLNPTKLLPPSSPSESGAVSTGTDSKKATSPRRPGTYRRPRRLSTDNSWGFNRLVDEPPKMHVFSKCTDRVTQALQDAASLNELAETGDEADVESSAECIRAQKPGMRESAGAMPPPKELFPVVEDLESKLRTPQTGIGRELQQPLHDHALNAVEDPVPGYVSEVPLSELIAESQAARAEATKWVPRTVFNYEFGEPRSLITHYAGRDGPTGRIGELSTTPLRFESRFESGNLSKAVQVAPYGYELSMQNDINTQGNTQWFYFACSDMVPGKEYTFWIRNFYKKRSLYNDGMMPVGYSMTEQSKGWKRCGSHICYYKGEHRRSDDRGFLYCLCFKLRFDHADDTVYLANFYPYTYTNLQRHLHELQTHPQRQKTFRRRQLCHSLAGNVIDMLVVTNPAKSPAEMKPRRKVVISARVHPGEVNASWMMKGVLEFLTGDSEAAEELRDVFIFTLIPMLNPDGVINGNYRTSIIGRDLNRQWRDPTLSKMPAIFNAKKLLANLSTQAAQNDTGPVAFYIDLHGHSRAKGVFTYGCAPKRGERTESEMLHATGLPWLIAHNNPSFEFDSCTYNLSKSKASTARIVSYTQCGIAMSYTLEASFMGGLDDIHFTPDALELVGQDLGTSLLGYARFIARHEPDPACPWSTALKESPEHELALCQELLRLLPGMCAGPEPSSEASETEASDDGGSDSDPSAGNVSEELLEILAWEDPEAPAIKPKPKKKRAAKLKKRRELVGTPNIDSRIGTKQRHGKTSTSLACAPGESEGTAASKKKSIVDFKSRAHKSGAQMVQRILQAGHPRQGPPPAVFARASEGDVSNHTARTFRTDRPSGLLPGSDLPDTSVLMANIMKHVMQSSDQPGGFSVTSPVNQTTHKLAHQRRLVPSLPAKKADPPARAPRSFKQCLEAIVKSPRRSSMDPMMTPVDPAQARVRPRTRNRANDKARTPRARSEARRRVPDRLPDVNSTFKGVSTGSVKGMVRPGGRRAKKFGDSVLVGSAAALQQPRGEVESASAGPKREGLYFLSSR
eukprot:TRINITY_DN4465_c0_g1_i4.p1 TRINITY_DN4465_c0_g1~~TRINITY_DN4465_c0_g1_i4.p1  ORF type:complete len:1052 (+),score=170.78 TRINITY_DN4465_c0_g1_i4:83-3238(+)